MRRADAARSGASSSTDMGVGAADAEAADTRPGAAARRAATRVSVAATKNGLFAKSIFGFGVSKWSVGRQLLVLRAPARS